MSKRLERVERQLRVQRVLTSGAAIAVVVLATMGAPLAQGSKTIPDRVADLEKRLGGVLPDGGATRFVAPFEVVNRAGKKLVTIDEVGEVVVGEEAGGGLRLGVGKSGSGFLSLREATGNFGITLGRANQGPLGIRLYSGTEVRASLELDKLNEARLKIGRPDGGGVEAGVGNTGSGFLSVQRPTGDIGVLIGRYLSRPLGVEVLNEKLQPAASLYSDALGGNVRVMNSNGVPVGGLFSEEEGGGLVLTGPAGGDSIVDLGIRAGGGSVQVYPLGGGTARAGLVADGAIGRVIAFNAAGQAVASLTSRPGGAGLLELSNGPTSVVQAGATTGGEGIVRVGPSYSAATTIYGKK